MNACLFILCVALSSGDGAGHSARDAWLAEDKFKHFFTSFAVTALAAGGARAVGLDGRDSLVAGATVGIGAGVWKEIRDHRAPGRSASVRDLVWDAAGVGAAVLVLHQSRGRTRPTGRAAGVLPSSCCGSGSAASRL